MGRPPGSDRPPRRTAVTLLALLALACAAVPWACTGPASREERTIDEVTAARLDPRLRQLAGARPDSVVGVLVRTAAPIGADERASLETAGLDVGSVAGDIVTGRIRAGALPRVARLPFVRYVEAARALHPTRPRRPRGS